MPHELLLFDPDGYPRRDKQGKVSMPLFQTSYEKRGTLESEKGTGAGNWRHLLGGD